MKIELPFWPPAIVTVRVQYWLLNHHSSGSSLTALGVWLLLVLVLPLIMASASVREACPTLKPLWWSVGCFTFSLVLVAAALWFWGAVEVRGDIGSVAGLTLVGAVWLAVSQWLVSWLGLSFRDDVLERKNRAAMLALGGANISIAIAFAAGNLGEGPSYSENIFSAALSTGALLALWFMLELGGRVSCAIAEERDVASGMRLGGLLLCWALILGRAVTGNWHSAAATIHDFVRDGWPALLLCLVALPVELLLQPSRQRPFPACPACGLVPVQCYVAGTVLWLWHLGRWEGMPQ